MKVERIAISKRWPEFEEVFRSHGVGVEFLPDVDPCDPSLNYIIYIDFSWRWFLRDRSILKVPRHKRVALTSEPSNINPSLYFVPFFRNLFAVIFTFNEWMLRRPHCVQISHPMMTDVRRYRHDPPATLSFGEKKMLAAVATNRWSYMPTSNFRRRRRIYRWFDSHWPDQFDLWGVGWNVARNRTDRWFGYPRFQTFRGPLLYTSKIGTLAQYRFNLAFENNVHEPGYVSEKLIDAFCARCVPVYYGTKSLSKHVPPECYIDYRDYGSPRELANRLAVIDAPEHARFVAAINRFLASDAMAYFSNTGIAETIHARLFPD